MIYRALEVIQIFLAGGRANGRTDEGVPRGPRGPKNLNHPLQVRTRSKWSVVYLISIKNMTFRRQNMLRSGIPGLWNGHETVEQDQWILKRSALLSFSTILSPNSWKNNRPVFCSLATVASLLSCWVRVQDNCTDMWHSWEGGTDIRHQNTAPIYGTNYMQHSFW